LQYPILPNCNIFVTISPSLSSISIKGMHHLPQRVALECRWLTLDSCIFMDTTIHVGKTPHVDWDTT
jgi:hypothetical protein